MMNGLIQSLTLISKTPGIGKLTSFDDFIYYIQNGVLFKDGQEIINNVFDYVLQEGFILTVDKETSDMKVWFEDKTVKSIKGDFYLRAFKDLENSFLISNGYQQDGFHLKIKIMTKDSFEERDFFGFDLFLKNNYLVKKKHKLISYSDSQKTKWQVEVSQYGKGMNDPSGLQDASIPNSIEGDLMGYEDTLVVPLQGRQLLGLNLEDGSKKWLLELKRQEPVAQQGRYVYAYNKQTLWEIDMVSGTVERELNISPVFEQQYNDSPRKSIVSNGKLIIDFVRHESAMLIIDIEKLQVESVVDLEKRAMLKVFPGDVLWHDGHLYARDRLSKVLYIFGKEVST